MHGRDQLIRHSEHGALAAALRALPESAPQPDLWPGLAAALAAKRQPPRRWRYAVPAALAAAIALAVLLPKTATHETTTPRAMPTVSTAVPDTHSAVTDGAAASDELAQLHRRSRTLEQWVAAVAARAPQDGRDLMAAVEVEDLIGLVDVQLGGSRGDADALPLWRQRVALLEDLATIRGNAFAFADNGAGADGAPVSPNLMN